MNSVPMQPAGLISPTKAALLAGLLCAFRCSSSDSPETTDSCVGVVDNTDEVVVHNTDDLFGAEGGWEIVVRQAN